jgi:hypothetical protein
MNEPVVSRRDDEPVRRGIQAGAKGRCPQYETPILVRHEKLKEITRVGATSGQIIG